MTKEVNEINYLLKENPIKPDAIEPLLEDLIDLTENIDLANVFMKVGGVDILLILLFSHPSELKLDALQLLANVTQNNIDAQSIFTQKNVLPRLLLMIEDENDPTCLRRLFSASSCKFS